jgi:hypothetical protein
MPQLNWTDAGIQLTESPVSRQAGDNKSDRHVIGTAIIPTVVDIPKFLATFGNEAALGSINGTSIRVMAQDVNRRAIEGKWTREALELALWNRLKGVRNPATGTTRTVVKFALADGTIWEGDNFDSYEAAQAAALIDMGLDPDTAKLSAKLAREKAEKK